MTGAVYPRITHRVEAERHLCVACLFYSRGAETRDFDRSTTTEAFEPLLDHVPTPGGGFVSCVI
jgi:hypothetical protein